MSNDPRSKYGWGILFLACLVAIGGMLHPEIVKQACDLGEKFYITYLLPPEADPGADGGASGPLDDPLPHQPNWTWTTDDGKVFHKVVVQSFDGQMVTISHSLGVAHVPLVLLPPEIQKQFHANPAPDQKTAAADKL